MDQRLTQLRNVADELDSAETAHLIIVEPGDVTQCLEQAIGCPILTDWFGESRYGEDDFAPAFEWLEAHLLFYELGYVTSDSGSTTVLIVPKLSGVASELLGLCREFAQPAHAERCQNAVCFQ